MSADFNLIPPRRIITGHDDAGKSVFLEDKAVTAHPDGFVHARYYEIWRTNGSPSPITATEPREPTDVPRTTAPGGPGSVIRLVDFLPGFTPQHRADPTRPGMHRTESIDYAIVLEGEIWAVLDDSETCMKTGDVLVQRGTDHAWRNRSDKVCRVAFILLGGKFDPDLLAKVSTKTLAP